MGEPLIDYRPVARTAVRRSLAVKKGENVIVETWNHGLPLAKELVYELRDVGARSILLFEDEDTYWRSLQELPKQKLGHVGSHEWAALKEADCYIFVPGPADVRRIREIGWEKYDAATAYNTAWYKNAERWGIRGVRIGLGYATRQRADSYGFDWAAWQQMLVDACVADPKGLGATGRKLERLLRREASVRVTAPNGTDFTFDLPGRSCEVNDGVTDKRDVEEGNNMCNLPGGSVYSTADETSGEGTFVADRPAGYLGKWMRGVSFTFRDGRLDRYEVAEGGEHLAKQFTKDKDAGKNRLAGLSIGLNPMLRYGFLQDASVAGAFHLGFGANEEGGGKNKGDFYLGGNLTNATVAVDGKAILRGGRLAV